MIATFKVLLLFARHKNGKYFDKLTELLQYAACSSSSSSSLLDCRVGGTVRPVE
jgi:hypothetical protein